MSMNRRGFFGVGAGAAVAGPAIAQDMAKSVAGQQAFSLNQGSFGGLMAGEATSIGRNFAIDPETAVRRAFKMGLVSREQLVTMLQGFSLGDGGAISHLDSDLSANKSFSLATRIRLQRERNKERGVEMWLTQPDRKSVWDMGRELLMKGLISEDAA
ncbi:hypothetical protein Pam5_62 [Pseudanabaena phage Pam5]|nr:hypothetical protein Pam5_62 [Pseudanabaena phage Pam5]